ncbi:RNA polymerase sigma-70 factor [Sanguibacteroides justesenii]|nr:RNA polymerase sigma-70 factor [Sanguibacteroides justesenii]
MWMINNYSDDKELQRSLKRGTISAFVYIYTTYFDALLNYADRLLNNMETARDVVQQVFYKVWEGRAVLSITLSVKAYLFKSVYYGSLNTLAHEKNVRKYEQEQLSDFYFSTIIQSPEAEIELWQSDIGRALQDAIDSLPERCREVFLLSKVEGLKNREIAERLTISEKTVERHMSIALSKLRDELDGVLQMILFFSFFPWG